MLKGTGYEEKKKEREKKSTEMVGASHGYGFPLTASQVDQVEDRNPATAVLKEEKKKKAKPRNN